jgi:hypothetical protein
MNQFSSLSDKSEVHCSVYKTPLAAILSHLNPVHILAPRLLEVSFHITVSLHPGVSQMPLLVFRLQFCMNLSFSSSPFFVPEVRFLPERLLTTHLLRHLEFGRPKVCDSAVNFSSFCATSVSVGCCLILAPQDLCLVRLAFCTFFTQVEEKLPHEHGESSAVCCNSAAGSVQHELEVSLVLYCFTIMSGNRMHLIETTLKVGELYWVTNLCFVSS